MIQKVIKIGNSLGVVIPKNLRGGLRPGSKVEVERDKDSILVKPLENKSSVDAKFLKMADEFMDEHSEVLAELAKR